MTDNDSQVPGFRTPPPVPASEAPPAGEPLLSALLKTPSKVAAWIAQGKDLPRSSAVLLVWGVACHAVFGLAVGLFGGWSVAAMDAVKAPLVALCSLLLCLPSLYVFACVGGSPLSLSQAFALGCSCLAMVGLLLVGLAPVAWLFAVSTESVPFVVVLALLVWLVAAGLAASYVDKLRTVPLFRRSGGILLWFLVLALVTLQMTTCMRPMLTKPESGWWTGQKQFFMAHFKSVFEPAKKK